MMVTALSTRTDPVMTTTTDMIIGTPTQGTWILGTGMFHTPEIQGTETSLVEVHGMVEIPVIGEILATITREVSTS